VRRARQLTCTALYTIAFLLDAGRLMGFFVAGAEDSEDPGCGGALAGVVDDSAADTGAGEGLGIGGNPPEASLMLGPAPPALAPALGDDGAG
jgi:hypothetical protein